MRRLAMTIAALWLGNVSAAMTQQSSPQPAPRFEVASIKPTRSAETATLIRQNTGGRFVAENITLFNLLQQAYDVYGFQIVGAPDWAERDRFDVQAIAPPDSSRVQQAALLRQLLEDRFMLRTRREMRERDVYALVIARADGQLGPNLRPFVGDCTGKESPCRMRNGPNFTDAVGMPFRLLVDQVIGNVNRFVVDKTGLSGRFDFKYEWTSDLAAANAIGDRVSFVTALQEQLGLRLVNDRAQVEVLAIDSVARPSPD
jgi:uncharacterized protein (TIGR03435 family)